MIRLDVQRFGSACAIAYAVLVLIAAGIAVGSGVAGANGAAQFLPILDADRTVAVAASALFVILPLLVAIAGIGLYAMLNRGEAIAWLALFGFVGGGISILYRGFTWMAMTLQLAPAYVHADATGKSFLAAVGDTLQVFAMGADMVGGVLVGGIGVLIVSALMHRQGIGPRWLAWLGILAALVGGWLTLLTPLSPALASISAVGDLAVFVWFLGVGIVAWRRPAPRAEPSGARRPAPNLEAALG